MMLFRCVCGKQHVLQVTITTRCACGRPLDRRREGTWVPTHTSRFLKEVT